MGRTALHAIALALVVLAASAAHLPRGASAGSLNLDILLYFQPIYEESYRRIAAGMLPLWNPYQLCGLPWLATLQGGLFYPLHVVYLVLPVYVGLAVSHAVHLGLAAIATAAFARRVGLTATAAFLAAVLFTTRGMLVLSLATPSSLEAAAWLPVGALAVTHLVGGRLSGGAALLAASTALSLLAGYPQPTVYATHVWGTLLVVLLVRDAAPCRHWLTTAAAFGAALFVGALGAGIQLGPTLELLRDGTHRALSPEARAPYGSISFAGTIFGSAAIAGSVFSWGVVALALGAVGITAGHQRAIAWWALVVTLLAVVLSLGERTPLFHLYRLLPGVDAFRFPDRILGVIDFTFAIAAALGLDAIERRRAAPDRTAPRAVALAVVLAVVGLAWTGRALEGQLWRVTAVAMATAALLLVGGRRASLAATGLALLATLETLLAPWHHLHTYDAAAIARYDLLAAEYRAAAERAGTDRVWFAGAGIAELQAHYATKLATRRRIRVVDDYEPLAPSRHAAYFTYFSEGALEYRRPPWLFAGSLGTLDPPPDGTPAATRRRLLDLAAVRFVVVPASIRANRPGVAAFLDDAGLTRRPFSSATLELWENPNVAPRAFVVYRTRRAPPAGALFPILADPRFDPLTESWVESGATSADAPARGAPARIVIDDENVVEVDATLDRPGLVVLADAYHPGWRVTVDGTPADVVATNHLFRGVAAPAGTHRVRFEYRPTSIRAGAIASAIGWVLIALLAVRARGDGVSAA